MVLCREPILLSKLYLELCLEQAASLCFSNIHSCLLYIYLSVLYLCKFSDPFSNSVSPLCENFQLLLINLEMLWSAF